MFVTSINNANNKTNNKNYKNNNHLTATTSTATTITSGSTLPKNTLQPSHRAAQSWLINAAAAARIPTTNDNNSRPTTRAPSILDSPTLARVERARLRLEATTLQQPQQQQQQQKQSYSNGSSSGSNATTLNREDSLERSTLDPKRNVTPWQQMWTQMKRLSLTSKVNSTNTLMSERTDISTGKCLPYPHRTATLNNAMLQHAQQIYYKPDVPSLLSARLPVASMTGPIKRGLLWQQRDRLFSRWKERYFVLTRDYLHCFKRASGSANERASDMGQFIFKVKLVDVEKVEWLNRRSYSTIGLLLGREGRILLRCDNGLEDWFELLEECTVFSKQRRHALKIAQGPRSRASLAAPVSHATLESQHFGLGSTYSSALEDWLMTNGSGIGGRNKIANGCGFAGTNPFLFSDSVPDLSALNNDSQTRNSGVSTHHSTPQKVYYSRYNDQSSRPSNSFTNCHGGGMYESPRRIFINKDFSSNQVVDEEADDEEVELRRPNAYHDKSHVKDMVNGNVVDGEWLYRKPRAPTETRHSVQPILPTNNNYKMKIPITDLDHSGHDSGVDTPPSTYQRPASYREISSRASIRDSTKNAARSSQSNIALNSPNSSTRTKQNNHVTNLNQMNALHGSHLSVQERILQLRSEENRWGSLKSESVIAGANRYSHNALYDQNKNLYADNAHKSLASTPQGTPFKKHSLIGYGRSISYDTNGSTNGNSQFKGSAILRERFQHPALAAIKAFY